MRQQRGSPVVPDRKRPKRAFLTNSLADSVEPSPDGETIWDTKIPGFGLNVRPSGHKTYILKYRASGGRGGQQRKPKIGTHGAITCQQAREIARTWYASSRIGGDPSGERQALRDSPRVIDLGQRYLEDHARLKKKSKSARGDESAIRRLVNPAIGAMKVTAVKRTDIERLHRQLKDTPPHANRIVALLSKMFNLAERWGLRPPHSNPCRGIERYREFARERFLTTDELRRLEAVLKEHDDTNFMMTNLIRMLFLTGARRGELESLKWAYVDLDNGRLRLPDSKTGAKVIVLSNAAVDLLRGLPTVEGNPFVFFGARPGKPVNGMSKFWGRIRRRAGLDGVRLHDLRHSFASQAVANGASLPMIGKLLGHKSTATTARYAHLLDAPLRDIADGVAKAVMTDSSNISSSELTRDWSTREASTKLR